MGLVLSTLEIYISKYQVDNFKKCVNSLSLDSNIFSKSRRINNVIVDKIIDISSRYGVLLDFILSFENWIKRFSREYHGNTFKNKEILTLITSISSEFDILKLRFNKFSNDVDLFIDSIFSNNSSKRPFGEKIAKAKYKKEIENLYKELETLNLEIKKLVNYQQKLITSSSLYIVKLDSGANQLKTARNDEVIDMSNENSLYDLWIFYEHHRLPNLKEKVVFLSRSISLLIYQNKILLEFLLKRYRVLTKQYSEFFNCSKCNYNLFDNLNRTRSENLRANSTKLIPSKKSEYSINPEVSIQLQQEFFTKCLDAEDLGLMTPLDSFGKTEGIINIELFNVIHMVKFLIGELEIKCSEFQRNHGILSEFKTFIDSELRVNTTNINDFFFSGKPHIKKSVFSQLTYQVSQLNTISEFAHTLEQSIKTYHYFNIPCYFGIVNYYLKQSFDKFFNIFYNLKNNPKEKGFSTINMPKLDSFETKNPDHPYDLNRLNITITNEMIAFMFNSSEIASSARSSEEFKKFPNFETKYNYTIFTNITDFPPNLNLGGISENLEVLMDRFLKSILVHEKKVNDEENNIFM
ncbi:uncharacterized protein cubi_01521 [Cryptosporidium ubiquitum]|uniref:Uncharacterized protein n=1 Tax=Cryptosporidium ubiquitum TaxID=857276 RepID=A0A1J4MGN9_9CRYT|nr:uncharacterized protein cubi_01521 [Cryptosporidium ubiquitum]OII72188.1 hypothetical protein cubi_01521 [Cryptosporidium ubiquitum]